MLFSHLKPASLGPIAMAVFAAMAPSIAGCSRGHASAQEQAPAHAEAAPPPLPAIEFVGGWGTQGGAPGQLKRPVGLAVDSAGRVYLADRGTGFVQKFEVDGTALLTFEDSAARTATAIAVDSGGGIYVADAHAGEIRIFFPEGDLIRVLHMTPQRGFDGPFDFSIGADGRIFVPDPTGGKVQALSPHGLLLKTWKVGDATEIAGKQARPIAAVAAPDGFVYVADQPMSPGASSAGRILKFSVEGTEVAAWESDVAAGPVLALAVSPKYVFALNAGRPRLQIWTLDGKPRLSDDLGGRLGTAQPAAWLAISPQGELLVLLPGGAPEEDPAGPRVLRFRIHLDSP